MAGWVGRQQVPGIIKCFGARPDFLRRIIELGNAIHFSEGHLSRRHKEMAASLEETLISVWRQVLVEDAKTVALESGSYPVRRTSRSKLCQVDFRFENQMLRGLEQNPNTGSRWAELARVGKKVMQFLDSGRYVANVVDGEVKFYGRRQRSG